VGARLDADDDALADRVVAADALEIGGALELEGVVVGLDAEHAALAMTTVIAATLSGSRQDPLVVPNARRPRSTSVA
jgi:hypothetical protein